MRLVTVRGEREDRERLFRRVGTGRQAMGPTLARGRLLFGLATPGTTREATFFKASLSEERISARAPGRGFMVSVAGTDSSVFYSTATGPTSDRACGKDPLGGGKQDLAQDASGCVIARAEGVNFGD